MRVGDTRRGGKMGDDMTTPAHSTRTVNLEGAARAAIAGGNEVWETGLELVEENSGVVQEIR